MKMPTFLPAVAEQLFRDIKKIYQETSQIPDDLLIALKFVFGSCALQSLDLVDQRSVTCLSSPSGRKAFQEFHPPSLRSVENVYALPFPVPPVKQCVAEVLLKYDATTVSEGLQEWPKNSKRPVSLFASMVMGSSGRLYTCFLSCHFCPCPAFAYTVLRRNEGLLCKHILAVYLCQAMAVTQQESVSDQQMSMLLSGTGAP